MEKQEILKEFREKFTCTGGTEDCKQRHERMLKEFAYSSLEKWLVDHLESVRKNHLVDLADAQLTGYAHSARGYSLEELVSSMGLTGEEWEKIKREYPRHDLTTGEIEEIDSLTTDKQLEEGKE